MNWRWISTELAYAIHDRQISEHGGLDGIRDQNAVESALARPLQIANYDQPDAAEFAAAYACGLEKNHGFADGNKRTAWVLARLFLADNGYRLTFDKLNAVDIMERVAGGQLSEHELADWFRHRLTPIPI